MHRIHLLPIGLALALAACVLTGPTDDGNSNSGSGGATTTSMSSSGIGGDTITSSSSGSTGGGTTSTGGAGGSSTSSSSSSSSSGSNCPNGLDIKASTKALLSDALGFAEKVTGGAAGCLYKVTNLKDSGAGSLREGAEKSGAAWIVFDVSGDIHLKTPIEVASNKTIDGRGQYIRIYDRGLYVLDKSNVIIENLIFKKGGGADTNDAIQIKDKSKLVWVDHTSLSDYPDGLLDITRASTDVTVSWCKFSVHDKTMLIGAAPEHTGDSVIRVTLHHNWFRETTQRHPRLRFGKVHTVNNFYDGWLSYGAVSNMYGELYSEANVYGANNSTKAVLTKYGDPKDGYVLSTKDLKLNGAVVQENQTGKVFKPSSYYKYTADSTTGLSAKITANAGWRMIMLP